MSQANAIFTLDGVDLTVQCSPEDKMRDICLRYVAKIGANLNSLLFLYGGNQLNFDLRFKEQANSLDKENNKMRVLVYKNEEDGFICPKCGEKIKLNAEKIDDLILSNNNIKDNIIGIKAQIENIINSKNSSVNLINIQLKNINIVLNTINEDINKNNEKLKKLLKENNEVLNGNLNEITNTIEQIKYDDGKYVGQIVNGKKEGKGIRFWDDGDRYEGDWKNDKMEGKGIYY